MSSVALLLLEMQSMLVESIHQAGAVFSPPAILGEQLLELIRGWHALGYTLVHTCTGLWLRPRFAPPERHAAGKVINAVSETGDESDLANFRAAQAECAD